MKLQLIRKAMLLLTTLLVITSDNKAHAQTGAVNGKPDIDEREIIANTGYENETGRGLYSVWYGCQPDGERHDHIEKPFIFVEGFDGGFITSELDHSNVAKYFYLYAELHRQGFDIIQLDFRQNQQFIQRNAEIVITLLENIQDEMTLNGSKHEIVIMGVSMGGQIAKYALAKMESEGKDHNVKTYISHDSQHGGANIPWGLQYLILDLTKNGLGPMLAGAGNISKISERLSGQKSGFEAAFQLVKTSPSLEMKILRKNYLDSLDAVGNYPTKCRKIATANGSGNGVGYAPRGSKYEIVRLATPDLLLTVRTAYASPGTGIITGSLLSRIVYTKASPLFHVEALLLPDDKDDYDIAPGSGLVPHPININEVGLILAKNFNFTPTISALALDQDPFFDVSSIAEYNIDNGVAYTFNNNITPFDAFWVDGTNSPHGDMEDGMRDFIFSEICPSHLYVQGRTLESGDKSVFEGRVAVTVCKDETNMYPVGDVVFKNGSDVLIRSEGKVYFKPGFKAEAGAAMTVKIERYTCY